jgi:phosphoserine phosphatase SerB
MVTVSGAGKDGLALASVRFAALRPMPAAVTSLAKTWNDVDGDGRYGTANAYEPFAAAVESVRRLFPTGATVGCVPSGVVRAVFFDMDATVVAEETLVELAARAGRGAEVQAITDRAMRGELDFEAALRARVAMLKGSPVTIIEDVGASLTLSPGIKGFVAACKELSVPVYLISGGFVELADGVARDVGFAGYEANRLEVSGGKLTGGLVGKIVDGAAKRQFLLATCATLKVDAKDVAAVGDGANDVPMMKVAGIAVGFKPKPVLWPHVQAQDVHGDHGFLGPLLLGKAAI